MTGSSLELAKAGAILNIADIAGKEFVIKELFDASQAEKMPSASAIESELGDISIGTFSNPPLRIAENRAIVDIHNDSVVVFASTTQAERIINAVKRFKNKIARAKTEKNTADTAGPNDSNTDGQNRLFENLLDSLEQAESKSAESGPDANMTDQEAHRQLTPRPIVGEPNKPEKISSKPAPPSGQPKQPEQTAAVDEKVTDIIPAALHQPEKQLPETAERNVKPPAVSEKSDEPDSDLEKTQADSIPEAQQQLELALPEKLNIVDLLDLVGKYLNLDYLYDPDKVKGFVTLKVQGPIKVKDLYPLLESVLKFRGFAMTRKGNLVTIVPGEQALDIDPVLVDSESAQLGDVVITRIFELNYVDTDTAAELLDQMKLGADITQVAETGTLIITGYAYRMKRIQKLLDIIDKPGKPRQFRFRQLKYTTADSLAPKIKTLAEQMGGISITVAEGQSKPSKQPQRRVPRKPTAKQPAAAPRAKKAELYLDSDERTNRILMIGFEDELDVVNGLIDALDVQKQDLRTLRMYEIQHVDAMEVQDKLQQFGIGGAGYSSGPTRRAQQPSKSAKSAPAPAAAAGSEPLAEEPQIVVIEPVNSLLVNATTEQHIQIATVIGYVDSEMLEETIPYEIYQLENRDPENLTEVLEQLIQETIQDKEGKIERVKLQEETPTIVPDPNTLSIIVFASRKNQEWIGRLIKRLDRRRPQVLIDVTLVEISRTDTFQYDLDLVTSFPDLATTSGLTGISDMTSATTSLLSAHRNKFFDFSSSEGTGKGFLGDKHVQALLTLMKQKKYGRVLAKPKILVNDNQTGHIKTETTTYVARSSETTVPTGEAVVATSYSFDEFGSGISLDITPHISEGDLLRLEIEMSRSTQATAGGTNAPPPDKTENNIRTVVTVPDKSTIILGGILTLDQDKDSGKVPLFGDIPLIGGLFRNIDNSDIETKLYIFVRADILRPSDTEKGLPDLQSISQQNRMAFEDSEEKFQQQRQWPGVESEPLDPLRVLDAQ